MVVLELLLLVVRVEIPIAVQQLVKRVVLDQLELFGEFPHSSLVAVVVATLVLVEQAAVVLVVVGRTLFLLRAKTVQQGRNTEQAAVEVVILAEQAEQVFRVLFMFHI
jgi:hypothetical protein